MGLLFFPIQFISLCCSLSLLIREEWKFFRWSCMREEEEEENYHQLKRGYQKTKKRLITVFASQYKRYDWHIFIVILISLSCVIITSLSLSLKQDYCQN